MASPKKINKDKVIKCYYCGEVVESTKDHVIKQVPMMTRAGVRNYNRQLHVDCMLKYNEKLEDEELKKYENDDWDNLYQYFRSDILGISKTQRLDDHSIKRLLGMRLGQYYPSGNNTRILPRGYSYKTILLTLKIVKPKVLAYMKNTNFTNGQHRTNSIMKFVESEINDVNMRLEAQRKSSEKLSQNEDVEGFDYVGKLREKKIVRKGNGAKEAIESLFGGIA